jgi:hypothetical protein
VKRIPMKQNTLRIINSCGVTIAICVVGIYNTVHRGSDNSIDYQLNINYQAHPVASLIGSIIPGIVVGFAFYWLSSWRARRKQKKLSYNPKEVAHLAVDNIDEQYTDKINNFLRDASARDIQEYIHAIPISAQSAYIPNAIIALNIRLAEDAEIITRRIVNLTWVLLAVSVALLVFSIWQPIIIKQDAGTHQIQARQNRDVVKTIANTNNTGTNAVDDSWLKAAFPNN